MFIFSILTNAGFDREIEPLERYRVIGDQDGGVHNLEIKNVSLEDNGVFQCQVIPFNFASPIRASAQVTVLGESIYYHINVSQHINNIHCLTRVDVGLAFPINHFSQQDTYKTAMAYTLNSYINKVWHI